MQVHATAWRLRTVIQSLLVQREKTSKLNKPRKQLQGANAPEKLVGVLRSAVCDTPKIATGERGGESCW